MESFLAQILQVIFLSESLIGRKASNVSLQWGQKYSYSGITFKSSEKGFSTNIDMILLIPRESTTFRLGLFLLIAGIHSHSDGKLIRYCVDQGRCLLWNIMSLNNNKLLLFSHWGIISLIFNLPLNCYCHISSRSFMINITKESQQDISIFKRHHYPTIKGNRL